MKHADPNADVPREVELKLHLPPGSRAILEASSYFVGAESTQQHLVTTYFDTAEGLLDGAGLTLRVRRSGDALTQTVKSRAAGRSVASDRSEWEWPIRQDHPDSGCLAGVKELAGIAKAIDGRLQPLFVSDIRRSTRLLHLEGGTIVEAAFDEGCIVAGVGREPVSELELELKGGHVDPLYQLTADLHALAPFWISPESKASRGWRLQRGRGDGAQKAHAPRLGRNIGAAEAVHDIIGAGLGHLIANIGPTLQGDPEGLHQMRVAMRGCRAALRLFMPYLDAVVARELNAEFRRFGRTLGVARDWDVFVLETLSAASTGLSANQLQALQHAGQRERRKANSAVKEAVQGYDFTEVILRLAGWLEAELAKSRLFGDGCKEHGAQSLVPEVLDRAASRTRKRARHAGRLSAEDRHLLRKSLKRLSYAVGHLAGPYRRRTVKTYRTRCATLQRKLGAANDAAVTRRLAVGLVADEDPALAEAGGALASWSDRQSRKALKGFGRATTKLFEARRFWV